MKLYLCQCVMSSEYDAMLDGGAEPADEIEYSQPIGCVFTTIDKAKAWAIRIFADAQELDVEYFNKVEWIDLENDTFKAFGPFEYLWLTCRQVNVDPE